MIAARVADQLKASGVDATLVKGGLGEISVSLDGDKKVKMNPLVYPRPSTVVNRALPHLKGTAK
jgi:hypothetical protein